MKVTLLPSAIRGAAAFPPQYLTSYLVNDRIAIDAGSVGLVGLPQEQSRIKHIFLTHSHFDHIASLPIFLENAFDQAQDSVTVYGSPWVLDALQQHVFNGLLWPDFIALSVDDTPFLNLVEVTEGEPIVVEDLTITPVPVDHTVPTLSYLVTDAGSTVAVVADTGPTQAIWDRCNALPNLRAVFLEVTFPNALQSLADLSKHLTPQTLAAEIRKLNSAVPVITVHHKARFYQDLLAELQALQLPQLQVIEPGTAYEF